MFFGYYTDIYFINVIFYISGNSKDETQPPNIKFVGLPVDLFKGFLSVLSRNLT
jgi:hypothetical protein